MPKLVPELYCTDIHRSLAFYVDVLGFGIKYERPKEGFAYLDRQGAELMLDEVGKTRTWLAGPLERPFGRGVNFQIETTDIEVLHGAIVDSEYDVFLPLEKKWYRCGDVMSGNYQFIVCDPDGYMLRFFEDLGDRPI